MYGVHAHAVSEGIQNLSCLPNSDPNPYDALHPLFAFASEIHWIPRGRLRRFGHRRWHLARPDHGRHRIRQRKVNVQLWLVLGLRTGGSEDLHLAHLRGVRWHYRWVWRINNRVNSVGNQTRRGGWLRPCITLSGPFDDPCGDGHADTVRLGSSGAANQVSLVTPAPSRSLQLEVTTHFRPAVTTEPTVVASDLTVSKVPELSST